MNPVLLPEVLAWRDPSPQCELPLATEGVLRYVWESRFGTMLIEAKGGELFVNGKHVELHVTSDDAP